MSENRAERDAGHIAQGACSLQRSSVSLIVKAWLWVLLWFFHKQRHARPSDGQDKPTGRFLRGTWRQGKSLGMKPKYLGSNLSLNNLSVCFWVPPWSPQASVFSSVK